MWLGVKAARQHFVWCLPLEPQSSRDADPGEIGAAWLIDALCAILKTHEPNEKLIFVIWCQVTRKYYKEDVQYRICSFWLDRDDDDRWLFYVAVFAVVAQPILFGLAQEITEGRNIFDLMVWGEAEERSRLTNTMMYAQL